LIREYWFIRDVSWIRAKEKGDELENGAVLVAGICVEIYTWHGQYAV